jgi:O-antigen ligase
MMLAVHAPLALLMSRLPYVSTAHALLTAAIGLGLAVGSRKGPERLAYVGAYIVGAEVLWRMTNSQVFWEFGKYASSGIFLLFLLLHGRRRLPASPLVYFALLIPSTVLTVISAGNSTELHGALSSYLSGPLALAVAWCFFAQLQLSAKQLERLFLSLLCPTVSVATVALFSTLAQAKLTFTDESNFATSGGFGPNQVSGGLALGIVFALLWLLTNKGGWVNKTVIFAVLAFLATQAALTFSRGGLYNAAGASVAALYFFLRDPPSRGRVIMVVGAILLVGFFVVLPRLEEFTGGAISTRFKNVDLTHRDEIASSELRLWQENPILGVGPGMAVVNRRTPHTEATRLLAEHGLFGLFAIGIIGISAVQSVRGARNNQGKAVASSMVSFSLLFMLDKAMRLAAPAFTFGLAFATLVPNKKSRVRPLGRSSEARARRRITGIRRGLRGSKFYRREPQTR